MTSRVVHRPARTVLPLDAVEPRSINPPPVLPEGKTATGIQSLLPMAGTAGAMSMMMFFRGSGYAALGAVVMVVSISAAGIFYLTQRGQATRKRRQQRERYMDYLEGLREDLRGREQQIRERSLQADPAPGHLLDLVRDPARLWERRRRDADFLRVRVGTGTLPVRELELREDDNPITPADPFLLAEARDLVRRFRTVPGLPLRVDLDRAGDVSLVGASRSAVLEVARAIVAQVAARHAPDDVTLAVLTPVEREGDWGWVRWLPHLLDRERIGPAGPQPLLARDVASLTALLADDLSERAARGAQSYRHGSGAVEATTRRRLLVLDDAYGGVARQLPTPDQALGLAGLGITVVHLLAHRLDEPGEISCRVTVSDERVTVEDLRDPQAAVAGVMDAAPLPLVEGVARELAPLRLSPDSYDDGSGSPPADFPTLVGLSDPAALDLARQWRPRGERDFLRVPVGIDDAGRPVLLDLKEASQLGMGPHGLCVGATGSGKSELLRTLVLALAATHPPERLGIVLVDYKGGATFAPFEQLPHVAGLITNLASDASLVERMYTSLDGEVLRRQQVLADAGKITDITEYNLRRSDLGDPPDMPPLQHLLVIIDEFGELLTAKPEFVELFLRIGRIGRSVGVHLLLSSQRIESGKLRGLDTYLSYRLGLRTLSELESRSVLETPDAFHLPPLPGFGYLKVDVTVYQRFKSAYVSGPLADGGDTEPAPVTGPKVRPMPRFGAVPTIGDGGAEAPPPTRRGTGPSLLSAVVDQIAAAADPVQPIWLPPLPPVVTLDQAAGGLDLTADGVRLRVARHLGPGLRVPLGVLDDPARQWQGPWVVSLSESGGHLIVLGAPGAGKSTALRTLALGIAASYRPTDVGIYGVDLLGGGLRPLAGLPHVGGVAGRDDRERIRRTIDEVSGMLAERERLFQRHSLDTVDDLRAERAAGRVTDLACTEVLLLLDGYGQLAGEFESLELKVHDLLARGGRYGIHVAATARRWNEVRGAQQVGFGNRIELRMADPAESSIDPKLARALSTDRPGRALTTEKLVAQVALPRLDAVAAVDAGALAEAATLVRGAWTGPLPPPVRVLPAVLHVEDLDDEPGTVSFGRFESDFGPAVLDLFHRDQHVVALGDTGTGKTNLLRVLARGLVRGLGPSELVFATFDPRRGLAGAVPEAYAGGYANNPALAAQLANAVAVELSKRDPATGGHAATGPRIVLLVDDYDILAAAATQPLAPLVPFLAGGRDIGLHVLMTRRVMGSARGLYEPFPLAVRESGCLGLLMSGDRSEGQLFPGVRPSTLPVGRALLIRPGEAPRTVQTACLDLQEARR